MKKRKSLKFTMLFFMIVCWFIPLFVLSFFMLTSYRKAYIGKVEGLITGGIKNTSILVGARLDEGIRMMQKPSYDREWEVSWMAMEEGRMSRRQYYNQIRESLKTHFYSDERFDCYAFYEEGDETPVSYSSRSGYSYNEYKKYVQPLINRVMEEDSSYVQIHVADNRIYLIRNLYTVSGYERFGTFVVGMNSDRVLAGAPMELMENVQLCFNDNGEIFDVDGPADDPAISGLYQHLYEACETNAGSSQVYTYRMDGFNGYLYDRQFDNYRMKIGYVVNRYYVYESLYELYRILFVMILVLIPVILYGIYFLKRQVEMPVLKLVEASRIIRGGQIGTVVEGEPMPNSEFEYLVSSFNKMSQQVKHLFDTVYNEQLARKDAQIAALQAQINPHFLNNTLEMMNWQARMNNDIEVCRMIEALGTVLDHSMNRDNKKVVYLSEEIRCADAYLYIMSMRFGQRLQVEKEIDESLLFYMVPQLILQPLLENAIVHGIEKVKAGTIWLSIHHDESKVCLDVLNTGRVVEEKELERIRGIIEGKEDIDGQKPGKHTSIGIRNVNRRIRLVYGEEYGLSIEKMQDDRIRSRICIPFVQEAQE